MTDQNLDDVLGDAADVETKKKTTAEPKKKKAPTVKKVEPKVARENPVPLAPAQGDTLPGDKGYVYDTAIAKIQSEIAELAERSRVLQATTRALHTLRARTQPKRTDQQRYDRLKEIHDIHAAEKRETQDKVRTVLREMGILD